MEKEGLDKLRKLAPAAADELASCKLGGGGFKRFTNEMNRHVSRGARHIDLVAWKKVFANMDEHPSNRIETYFFACGIAGEASLLLVPRQEQCDTAHLKANVGKLLAAICNLKS